MHGQRQGAISGTAILMIVVLAVAAGAAALVLFNPWGENVVSQRHPPVREALIQYKQIEAVFVPFEEVRAIAVGPDDMIYVAGDKSIQVIDSKGKGVAVHELRGEPHCLAVAGEDHDFPERIYVGMEDHVEVYKITVEGPRSNVEHVATWEPPNEKAILTSIAVAAEDVFVADHGNEIVHRYKPDGELHGRIGARDDERNIPGFTIPSPFFDVGIGVDGLLRVANTGELRIETYSFRGDLDLERTWGEPAKGEDDVKGFTGCCNPANFAILPDGRFVTVEKGLPRVKIYSPQGEFLYIVAGARQLPMKTCDVATDSRSRVLLLDTARQAVRFFVEVPIESE